MQKRCTYLRLHAHILSHSIMTMALEEPCAMMKFFSPSTVIPLLRIPRTVGKRGSSLATTSSINNCKPILLRLSPQHSLCTLACFFSLCAWKCFFNCSTCLHVFWVFFTAPQFFWTRTLTQHNHLVSELALENNNHKYIAHTHQPVTIPWSTIHLSFLFDRTVFWRLSLLYS